MTERTAPPQYIAPAYHNRESQFYYAHVAECEKCRKIWLGLDSDDYKLLKRVVLSTHNIT